MTREQLKIAARLVLLAGALVVACATSQGSDSSDRLTAIEERLARLEADAGSDAADVSVIWSAADGGPDFALPHFVPDAAEDAVGQCMDIGEQYCAQIAADEIARNRPLADAGFTWLKDEPPPAASASPAGRKCLERVRRDCLTWKDRKPAANPLYEWLDSQLVPQNLDQAYTARIRSKIGKVNGQAPSSIDVECTKQFCRFGKVKGFVDAGGRDRGAMELMRFMDDPAQGMGDESHFYVVRKGYRLGG